MANIPEVKIQIDQSALRQQIHDVISEQFLQFSWRLRAAADALDDGVWIQENSDWVADERKKEYKRGYEDGKAARDE